MLLAALQVLEGVPEATAEHWLKLYYLKDLHNQPGKHKKDDNWPKATAAHESYKSHELLSSSGTYWKPGDGAQRMVLEVSERVTPVTPVA